MPRMPQPRLAADVKGAFDAMPDAVRESLLAVRSMIFEVAAVNPTVGRLEETRKWGQPAYLTPETKSGSTIRLGVPKSAVYDYALFVHCQTDLTRRFQENYPSVFAFEGTRAILFRSGDVLDAEALKHCIGLALTYHTRKQLTGSL
jgi:hypothetical protein